MALMIHVALFIIQVLIFAIMLIVPTNNNRSSFSRLRRHINKVIHRISGKSTSPIPRQKMPTSTSTPMQTPQSRRPLPPRPAYSKSKSAPLSGSAGTKKITDYPKCLFCHTRNINGQPQTVFWDAEQRTFKCRRGHKFTGKER